MRKMKNYYEILGIDFEDSHELDEETFRETVLSRYRATMDEIEDAYDNDEISIDEFSAQTADLKEAKKTLLDVDLRDEYDEELEEYLEARPLKVTDEEEDKKNSSGKGKKVLATIGVVALCAAIVLGAKGCSNKLSSKSSANNNETTVETQLSESTSYNDTTEESQVVTTETESETQTQESETQTQETETETQTQESETQTQESETQEVRHAVNYGDVMDVELVNKRAAVLVEQLNKAHVINPVTNVPYTQEEIVALIQYSNGVYIPTSQEEIDILHLNLLNLLISPLNTDDYLFHVVYASGNNDFAEMSAESSLNNREHYIGFAEAFAQYGENGVYPLIQWIQQKRFEIYSTNNREEINAIYREVGQVMADLMKGNGCTITLYEDKSEQTYTFTSEQVLANHSSAMLLTTEAQLIFANHYEVRDINDNIVDQVSTTWEVYNKLNSNGVDEDGKPIIEPDIVSYDEINAWINNGCDYEWSIDSVLIDGQTFGQRIQGDMEGMAQNNLAMSQGKTLTK